MYKRYYIKIKVLPNAEVKIYAPVFIDKEKIIEKYKNWIDEKIRFVKSVLDEIKGKEHMFLYRGRFLPVEFSDKNFITQTKALIKDFQSFREYLRHLASNFIKEKVAMWSRIMGIGTYNKINVRLSRKVWGSCSPKNNLNFSIRIIALPDYLVNYIVIHELSHLIYRKHSRAFWKYIRRYYPKYIEARKELLKYQIIIENNKIWQSILAFNITSISLSTYISYPFY